MSANIHQWSGESVYVLSDDTGATAHVIPDVGANCIAFSTPVGATRAHLLSTPASSEVLRGRPTFCGYPILSPYPGRHATPFSWDGATYNVETVERPGVMLHGFAARAKWEVVDASSDTLVCVLNSETVPERGLSWPFPFTLVATHRVASGAHSLVLELTNRSDCEIPHLLGLHPYFPLRFTAHDASEHDLPTASDLVGPDGTGTRETCHPWVHADDWWEMIAGLGTGRVEDFTSEAGAQTDLRHPRSVAELERTLAWSGAPGVIPPGTAPRLPVLLYGDRSALSGAREGRAPWAAGGITSGVDDLASGVRATLATSAGFPANALFCPPGFPFISLEPRSAMSNALGLHSSHPSLDTGIFRLAPGETWRAWAHLSASAL